MNKKFVRATVVSLLTAGSFVPASALAVTKVPVGKVGARCAKSGAAGKTAKGAALVCKKTGTKLNWALAKKASSTSVPSNTKAGDTTVPKAKSADSTVPKAKVADTTIPKAKAADTTVPKRA